MRVTKHPIGIIQKRQQQQQQQHQRQATTTTTITMPLQLYIAMFHAIVNIAYQLVNYYCNYIIIISILVEVNV